MKNNKEADNDWFRLESNKEGTKWFGKCWYIQNFLKYEFEIEFDVSTILLGILLHFPSQVFTYLKQIEEIS